MAADRTEFSNSEDHACRCVSFRMKDGNTVIFYAEDQPSRRRGYCRKLGCKARLQAENSKLRGYFLANRQGDLQTTAAASGHAQGTRPRLPLLQVARAHSYADLGTSGTDDCTQPVLFNKRER